MARNRNSQQNNNLGSIGGYGNIDQFLQRQNQPTPSHLDWDTYRKIGAPGSYANPPGGSGYEFRGTSAGVGSAKYGMGSETHYGSNEYPAMQKFISGRLDAYLGKKDAAKKDAAANSTTPPTNNQQVESPDMARSSTQKIDQSQAMHVGGGSSPAPGDSIKSRQGDGGSLTHTSNSGNSYTMNQNAVGINSGIVQSDGSMNQGDINNSQRTTSARVTSTTGGKTPGSKPTPATPRPGTEEKNEPVPKLRGKGVESGTPNDPQDKPKPKLRGKAVNPGKPKTSTPEQSSTPPPTIPQKSDGPAPVKPVEGMGPNKKAAPKKAAPKTPSKGTRTITKDGTTMSKPNY